MLLPTLILIRRMAFLSIGMYFFVQTGNPDLSALIISVLLTVTFLTYFWRKVFRKEPTKFWHFSNIAEGIMALFVALVAISIVYLPFYLTRTTLSSPIGAKRILILTFILAAILYGLIGYLETIIPVPFQFRKATKSKQPKPLSTPPNEASLTKSQSPSVDDEISRLKQKVQSEDGYLSQSKPEPKDKKRRT